jgi:hypothetical protein
VELALVGRFGPARTRYCHRNRHADREDTRKKQADSGDRRKRDSGVGEHNLVVFIEIGVSNKVVFSEVGVQVEKVAKRVESSGMNANPTTNSDRVATAIVTAKRFMPSRYVSHS